MKQSFILSVIISFIFITVGVAAEKQETTVVSIPPSADTTVIDGPSVN